jgi:hypothetical protein
MKFDPSKLSAQALATLRKVRPRLAAGRSWAEQHWRQSTAVGLPAAVMLVLIVRMLAGPSLPDRARGSVAVNPSRREVVESAGANPQVPKALAAMREWTAAPIAPLSRNLFAVNLEYFPQDSGRIDQTLRMPQGNGFWDELEKSVLSRAEEKNVRQKLVEGLRLEAAQLHLQSIMMGPTPKAMINGALVSEGDAIALFRVVKITARGIIVEREGIKLEISF